MGIYKNITELKNIHHNEDIWCIAAGSSMDFIDSSFFEGKIVIGQNQVYKKYPCSYIVMKDLMESPRFPRSIKEIESKNIPLIYSKHFKGHYSEYLNQTHYTNSYVFDHVDNLLHTSEHLKCIEKDIFSKTGGKLFVARKSTMTSIMHIAAYMGAKNIIVCGVDCGTMNGNLYYENYTESDWISADNWTNASGWIQGTSDHNLAIRDKIKEVYGCNIYSLNPFMNFNLDGNEYKAC